MKDVFQAPKKSCDPVAMTMNTSKFIVTVIDTKMLVIPDVDPSIIASKPI